MLPAKFDIEVSQGATFLMTLTLSDADDVRLDLADETFRGQIRTTYSSAVIVASFSFNVLNQSVAETKGQVEVSISAANTSAIPVDPATNYNRKNTNMIYDIESQNGTTGVVTRWLEGTAVISPEVTR